MDMVLAEDMHRAAAPSRDLPTMLPIRRAPRALSKFDGQQNPDLSPAPDRGSSGVDPPVVNSFRAGRRIQEHDGWEALARHASIEFLWWDNAGT
jgi:hypothetical protein